MTLILIENPNNEKQIRIFQNLPKKLKNAMRQAMYKNGNMLVTNLKKKLTRKGRSGKEYKIYRGLGGKKLSKPRIQRASSPTEFPNVITGNYRKSIEFKVRGASRLEFGSSANYAKDYAKILELGSKFIEARQPLGRVVRKLQNNVKTNINKRINKQLKIK